MKLECVECGRPLSNHGAASRGDGDIYDQWACENRECIWFQQTQYEVHATYCECIDCQGGCGKVHRCEFDESCFYIGDPY